MKSQLRWVLAAVTVVTLCLSGWSAFGQRQQATTATQWEYVMYGLGNSEQGPQGFMNELGTKGWELIAVNDGRAYFKRPKP